MLMKVDVLFSEFWVVESGMFCIFLISRFTFLCAVLLFFDFWLSRTCKNILPAFKITQQSSMDQHSEECVLMYICHLKEPFTHNANAVIIY